MKKTFIYSSIVVLLAAAACNKVDDTVSEEPIRFAFATDATRALVENVTGLQAQTLQVYDDMGGDAYYINDKVTYEGVIWNFVSGRAYTWKTGNHKFFAYTDGAGAFADNKLTVTKALTAAEADQVDLLYSDIVAKTKGTESITQAVTIPMNHLFSAMSIMVKNAAGKAVTVNKVTLPAILNQGTATVDFSGNATAVTYGTPTASVAFASGVSNVELAVDKLTDAVAKGEATDATSCYWLVWPQTIAAEALTVAIDYTINGKVYTSEVKLPAAETQWKAGYKYLYTLKINPHDIRLEFTVTKWLANEGTNIIVE